MAIVVVGLNHKSAPIEMREQFAIGDVELPSVLSSLRSSGVVKEAVIVSTCNRVEVYAAGNSTGETIVSYVRDFLLKIKNFSGTLNGEFYTYDEPESLIHLFRVACGLDSMVIGETEILGQLKKAYEIALNGNHTGGLLNRAFQRAFNVAKKIRSETNIQKGSISVASVAVELAERIFSSLKNCRILVIGAGDTAEKSAKAFVSRGASNLCFTNRSPEKAKNLASEIGGSTIPFEEFHNLIPEMDIVISSTSAPGYLISRHSLSKIIGRRKNNPILMIDLAVPRDINPDVTSFDNVYLYDIDDLQEIADDYLKQRIEEISKCEIIIKEKVEDLMKQLSHSFGAKFNH